jgi:hypothetical protein
MIACVSFSELENDTLNQAELNEIKINERCGYKHDWRKA